MVNTRARTKITTEDSTRQSTQSGALIGSCDDLLTEILIRLPVSSILRFKSVSKHWRLLLTRTHFTQRYDKLLKSPGIFAGDTYVPFDVENPSSPPYGGVGYYFDCCGVEIVQSCNGLLLCCSDIENMGGRNYYILNPTTKQLATIPPVPGGLKVGKTISFMGLAFHQTHCVYYKLVCIRSLDSVRELFQIQIYSSNTGKWKVSIESFSAPNAAFEKGVYWNGALHWAPSYRNPMYFKIDVEQLQMLPLPVEMMSSETLGTMYFGESRGHLHLIVYDYLKRDSLRLNVYEMLNDHSRWFIRYHVELDELAGAFPEMHHLSSTYEYEVVDVVRDEKEEDTFMVLKTPFRLITLNVHDKSFKKIFVVTKLLQVDFYRGCRRFHRYTEALVSF